MRKRVPPILKTPGLRLIEMGENEHGAYLRFAVEYDDPDNENIVVREVTIHMQANVPVRWTYEYSYYDRTTNTITTYAGRYGDRDRDPIQSVKGA